MTVDPLTVAFDTGGATGHDAVYAAHRAALAALPGSFRLVHDQPADVLVTVASGARWLDRITPLLSAPAKAVLIAGLSPSAVAQLSALAVLAADRGLSTAVASGPADDAAWRAALPDAAGDLDGLTFIDSVTTPCAGGSLFDALLGQLALVESLTGPLEKATTLTATATHYVVSAHAGSTIVSLSGTTCTAEPGRVELDLIGPATRWHAEFSAAGTARPAEITRHDITGAQTRRPLFQGPQRARWLRLRDDINAAGTQADTAGPLASLVARAGHAAEVAAAA
jgi:hypothetical protein